jgi:hypothetical protein
MEKARNGAIGTNRTFPMGGHSGLTGGIANASAMTASMMDP